MIKIMAPAGGRSAFEAALSAGADEIYMGLAGYGARQSAANFSADEFCSALDEAHRFGVKINLTLNTVMSDREIDTVAPDLARLDAAGLDGIILQDWGAADFVAKNFPRIARHASTQTALGNRTDVRWAEKNGFARIVLPRELTIDEISAIKSQTSAEIEVFSSGALCLACSGRCYLSSFIGGRSGNRGSCAQPCRQRYQIEGADSGSSTFDSPFNSRFDADGRTIGNEIPASGYLLSLTDQLQGADEIARLAQAGVDVIKIEGRMKSPVYVFEAVRYYRNIIDRLSGISPERARKIFVLKGDNDEKPYLTSSQTLLPNIFNRGYDKGYFYEEDPAIRHPAFAATLGRKIGEAENGAVRLTDSVRYGDGIVYVDTAFNRLGGGNVGHIDKLSKRSGERPLSVPSAEIGDRVLFGEPLPSGTAAVYRSFDYAANKQIEHALSNTRRHRLIQVFVKARIGQPLEMTLTAGQVTVKAATETPLEESKKRRMTKEDLLDGIDRFGETPFVPEKITLDFDEAVFIPKSALNQVRRDGALLLENACIEAAHRPGVRVRPFAATLNFSDKSLDAPLPEPLRSAAVRTQEQAQAALNAGISIVYRLARPVLFESMREKAEIAPKEDILSEITPNSGIHYAPLAGTVAEAVWFEDRKIPFAADWFFNVGNLGSAFYLIEKFSCLKTLYLSPELSLKTVQKLAETLSPILAARGGRIGLSVYGRLAGMTTRATLFPAEVQKMHDREDRLFTVVQNKTWFGDESLTGSTVYYGCNDIISESANIPLTERRYDFTSETPDEVTQILARKASERGAAGADSAYGFIHPIF